MLLGPVPNPHKISDFQRRLTLSPWAAGTAQCGERAGQWPRSQDELWAGPGLSLPDGASRASGGVSPEQPLSWSLVPITVSLVFFQPSLFQTPFSTISGSSLETPSARLASPHTSGRPTWPPAGPRLATRGGRMTRGQRLEGLSSWA